jgi:hypothetical protein
MTAREPFAVMNKDLYARFQAAMDRPEHYPAVLQGEFRLGGGLGEPAEEGFRPTEQFFPAAGGFLFRYELDSFRELVWVLEECFPTIQDSRLPDDVYTNLAQYPTMKGGGCLDTMSSFKWSFEKLQGGQSVGEVFRSALTKRPAPQIFGSLVKWWEEEQRCLEEFRRRYPRSSPHPGRP